ncbi:LytTR family DNA-binding domain-containing protein [uncultured Kordia sp.]|uniref:LytR/AlgR family response regulator transcription factor n=1 Tax=uncultured Kordia sp. TaxID=507699 RepID=UPI002616651A|nr:LytTR family DNA-binding domain-containing protein [uncultured Kordia sp.]
MKKIIFPIILFIVQSSLCQAPVNINIEETLQKIQETDNDSVKSQEYFKLSEKSDFTKDYKAQLQYADSALKYAKRAKSPVLQLQGMQAQILNALIKNDTARVSNLYKELFFVAETNNVSNLNEVYVINKLRHASYLIRHKDASSDSILVMYKQILKDLEGSEKYDLITEVLSRTSLLHRNRKEIGKALNYNKQEAIFAEKSKDPYLVAAAKVTELDLSYQLIPRPIKAEDVRPLIKKALIAEKFMEKHDILNILMFTRLYLAKFYIHETSYAKSEEILLAISDSLPKNIVFSKYEQLCEIAKSTNNLESYRNYTLKFKPIAYATNRAFVSLNVHNFLLDYSIKTKAKDSANYYASRLEENLAKVDTTQFLDYLYFTYDVLAKHYTTADKDKSIQYQTYANNINRNIIENQKEAFVNIVKYREEVENLQDENTSLNDSVSFLENNFVLLSILSIGLLALLVFVYKKYKSSAKEKIEVEKEKEIIAQKVARKSILLHNKQKVYLDDITYIKSDRNYVEVHTAEKTIVDRSTLSEIAEQLPPNFIKTHRSYIVNKNKIKSISGTVLYIQPDIEIPISRTFKKNVVS